MNHKSKNFKSPDNTERYVSSTMGWCFRIGPEWKSIPEVAWSDCYAAGCISEDMFKNLVQGAVDDGVVDTLVKVQERDDKIRNVILDWMEENDRLKFDAAGRPKAVELKKELGFLVTRDMRDKVWRQIQEDSA